MNQFVLSAVAKVVISNTMLLGVYITSFGPVTKPVVPATIQNYIAPVNFDQGQIIKKTISVVKTNPIKIAQAKLNNTLKLDVSQLKRPAKLYGNLSKTSRIQKILSNDAKRAQFNYVVGKLAEYKLPKELAVIPIIESQYSTNAVSRVGAGGMWQIMPATAKGLGISNKQRFELAPSTVAALKYFRDLHQQFNNWDLAVAAYNGGSGRVQKALKQNPHATSVQQLKLPLETLNYVKQFNQLQGEIKSYDI